ncbi:hypothetical protein DVR12_07370 [Chitinophaga silvatica]|uniref:Uncharacterized protein n=1 Tax=Chitinophaga silvatica TaxID=2282649 RepID=A0A3E1YFA5_9BACT|nr:hypothetical protein [Chitinophaga silvatica]RFS24997.1 hypothetical protein DVR12_07370 [Chitinophaga silvatica]
MITITILLLCFLGALSLKIKKVRAPEAYALLWYIHIIFGSLAFLCLLLMLNDWGFKGTQTERVFFTLYAGSGMLLFGLTKPDNDARYAYLLCLFGFPFLLLLGLLIPPLRIITLVIAITIFSDSKFTRYKIDDDFALQTKTTGILSAYPVYSLVEDKLFFFEKVTPDIISPKAEVRLLKMDKQGNDSVRIQLKSANNKIDTTIALKPGAKTHSL